MQNHTIALTAANKDEAHYGILFVSETKHAMTGKGLHNRSFDHIVQVWENRETAALPAGTLSDPWGNATTETHTFAMKAQATVLTAHRETPRFAYGDTIAVGDTVTLTIAGLLVGTFAVVARPLRDPVLERIA